MEALNKLSPSSANERVDLNKYNTQVKYLEDVRSLISYDMFEDPVDNEIGFAMEFSRYMDELEKRHPEEWETMIENFSNALVEKRDDPRGQIIYAKTAFKNLKKHYYQETGDSLGVLNSEMDLRHIESTFYKEGEEGSYRFPFSGPVNLMPKWFGARYSQSGMLDKMNQHSIQKRYQMIKQNNKETEKLKGLLGDE